MGCPLECGAWEFLRGVTEIDDGAGGAGGGIPILGGILKKPKEDFKFLLCLPERFSMAVSGIVGKRVTFDELAGKTEAQA